MLDLKKNLHNWAARGVAKWVKELEVIHLRVLPWVAGKDKQSVLEKTKKVETENTGDGEKFHCEQVSGNGWPAGH